MSKVSSSILFFLFLSMGGFCQVQKKSFQEKLYQYYINDDINSWEQELAEKTKDYNQASENELFDLVNGYYGLIGNLLNIEEDDKAEDKFDIATPILNRLININPKNMVYKAYEAAFIAFEMEFSMWKVMSLGAKSQKILEQAMQTSPTLAEVNFEWANMKYFAPSIAGGDKEEAIVYYKKAYTILEKNNKTSGWYYLKIKTRYADALSEQKLPNKAKAIYLELLTKEPNYKLAKEKMEAL